MIATIAHRGGLGTAVLASLLLLAACRREPPPPSAAFLRVIGSAGHEPGSFNRPRGIHCDDPNRLFYVVDWDGRIQKFTDDGDLLTSWTMPEVERGKPEDLCLASNGNLLVTDTHYSRIAEFTPEGNFVRFFGSYGNGPGQFVYPVGICVDDDGYIYVAEYGENERIQKFDSTGTYLGEWGSSGEAPGHFQRPGGIDLGPDGLIYVADAVNHRIQVFDTDGRLQRVIGRRGRGPGEFTYPYDVAVQGSYMYVVEYGGHRVQRLTLDGTYVNSIGEAGRGDGPFNAPWRLATSADAVYVSDTYNNRVVVLPLNLAEENAP